ncbi:hypothetical protein SDC9_79219 [bioreactor metagenome]|uniref:Uncharacterized protein n=1 Tax=bioreactor metagenome TaxID=1076179 RepID=A0A644Z3E5_9ZZZZ
MSEKYGSAPKPENKTNNRPVMCFNCKRVYLSRALSPKCGKCGSYKVIEYSSVSGSIDALHIRGSMEEMVTILQKHEIRQLKFEQALELQKTKMDELTNEKKGTFASTSKAVKKGEHPGTLKLTPEEPEPETELEKRLKQSEQRMKDHMEKLSSLKSRYPSPRSAQNQMEPDYIR